MANVFDSRTLTTDEQTKLRTTVKEGAKILLEINTIKEGLKDLIGSALDSLNDGIDDKDMKISRRLVNSMIRTELETSLDEKKSVVQELEDALTATGLV